MRDDFLVSVIVLSYNSSNTIVETLDSISNQTYQNVELIITDDNSSDNTVDIVKAWILDNSKRFNGVQLITSIINTGTSANVNRGLKASHGEWLKLIAADDALLPDCINKCLNFISSNENISWMVGKSLKYIDVFDNGHLIENDTMYTPSRIAVLNGDLEKQKKAILDYSVFEASALFIKKSIIQKVGGYNEKYTLLEDWPMSKKLVEAGYKCYFLDDYIVRYRKSSNSVFSVREKLFNFNFKKSEYLFIKTELFEYHNYSYKINKILHFKLCWIIHTLHMNNSRMSNRYLYLICCKLIDIIFRY